MQLVSLDLRRIDPPAPRALEVELAQCYWWTDEAGRLWIAMKRSTRPLLAPPGEYSFLLSLRLDEGLPAGPAREYRVTYDTLRARVRVGPLEARYWSQGGIVAIYRERGHRLRGSLRIRVRREVRSLLGRWTGMTNLLLLGSFTAVPDRLHGPPIAAATEGSGFERSTASSPKRPAATGRSDRSPSRPRPGRADLRFAPAPASAPAPAHRRSPPAPKPR